jgi:hypothetical protein
MTISNLKFLGGAMAVALWVMNSPTGPAQAKSVESPLPTESPATEGSWVPVARVDPAKPIQLNVVNKTGQTLEYLITTHTQARTLDPGKSVVLSNFALPIFLNINFPDQAGTVKYNVSTQKNRITVEVVPIGQFGDHTLNIADTGAIYLY